MSATIEIAPVKKEIRVAASQAHAFEVFTARIGSWWPKRASVAPSPLRTTVLETRLGGRFYQLGEDGAEAEVGRVRVWDPPQRLVVSWEINHHWKPDTSVASEVEVRFIADGPDATIVKLEHRDFEKLGAEGGASLRRDVDGGWPGILEEFRAAAEAP